MASPENIAKAKIEISKKTPEEIINFKAILRKKGYNVDNEDEFIVGYAETYYGVNGCISIIIALFAIGMLLFGLFALMH